MPYKLKVNTEYIKMLTNFPRMIIQSKILPHLTGEINNILSKISDKLRITTDINDGLNICISQNNKIIN